MEKINVAELLKDCPKGMELDCAMYENVEFEFIEQNPESKYPIHCLMKTNGGYNALVFTHNGCNDRHPNAKCVIYPKGKNTWDGFQRPFVDGDILVGRANQPFIFQSFNDDNGCFSYCGIAGNQKFFLHDDDWTLADSLRFATEEEQEKLFQSIKDNGYRWNVETKTLEKLIKPKFKVGDKIVNVLRKHMGASGTQGVISDITDDKYIFTDGSYMSIGSQDNWELVPNKFDTATLKPFDRVLVRDKTEGAWRIEFFSHTQDDEYMFACHEYNWRQCVPYESNEHLLGKTDDCDEYYKTWED